jgi:hypothetical protein
MVRAVVFAPKPFPVRETAPDKMMLSAQAAGLKSASIKAVAIAFFILHLRQTGLKMTTDRNDAPT